MVLLDLEGLIRPESQQIKGGTRPATRGTAAGTLNRDLTERDAGIEDVHGRRVFTQRCHIAL